MKGRLLAPVLAVALLLTGCTETGAQSPSSSDDQPTTQWDHPTTAPVRFSGKTANGSVFYSKDHLGQVVVVNFWYAGCAPCRTEAPSLNQLASELKGEVQFVGVNVSDSAATATSFERTYKTTYPSIIDQAQGAAVQLAFASNRPPKAVPTTLVLDKAGRVTARVIGLANESVLKTLVTDALTGAAN